jgi:hypothetical protein
VLHDLVEAMSGGAAVASIAQARCGDRPAPHPARQRLRRRPRRRITAPRSRRHDVECTSSGLPTTSRTMRSTTSTG